MTTELVPVGHTELAPELVERMPTMIVVAGERTAWRFVDFFTSTIRNPNTREAYWRAVTRFFDWCELRGVHTLSTVRPIHIADYVENMKASKPTVKQHLAAIRKCFDWLVSGGELPQNPASSVQGPKHIVRQGKTPVLDAAETRILLDSMPRKTLVGLRDRALIGTMVYTFGRVGAVIGMNVEDYFISGSRRIFRLHEKGGKEHNVPAHHNAMEYVDEYIAAAGLEGQKKVPIFQSVNRQRQLTGNRMHRVKVFEMIKRRTRSAGLPETTTCHTFRATGITNYLQNGGSLENARAIAAHESSQTTRLYDRSGDELTLDEIERVRI